jgi:hypothetical protein
VSAGWDGGFGYDDRDGPDGYDHPIDPPPPTITCVDCGGICHLLSPPFSDEDGHVGFRAGDIVAYRCEDCLDRWDIELE